MSKSDQSPPGMPSRPDRTATPDRSGGEPPRPRRDNLGQVLRDVYRDALDEGVPDDMLDLLRKLD